MRFSQLWGTTGKVVESVEMLPGMCGSGWKSPQKRWKTIGITYFFWVWKIDGNTGTKLTLHYSSHDFSVDHAYGILAQNAVLFSPRGWILLFQTETPSVPNWFTTDFSIKQDACPRKGHLRWAFPTLDYPKCLLPVPTLQESTVKGLKTPSWHSELLLYLPLQFLLHLKCIIFQHTPIWWWHIGQVVVRGPGSGRDCTPHHHLSALAGKAATRACPQRYCRFPEHLLLRIRPLTYIHNGDEKNGDGVLTGRL